MNYEQKYNENGIEIPFGAKDSELVEASYYIPEGMEAVIQGNKVIIKRKESEDERIRKEIVAAVNLYCIEYSRGTKVRNDMLAWLKKQKPVDVTDLRTWKYIVDAVLTEEEGIGQYLDSYETERIAKKLQKKFESIKPVRKISTL